MKKGNPLGTRLNTILENAQLESQNENIGDLDKILSPANNVNDMVGKYDEAGLNYFHTEHYKEAIEQFKKALSLRPEDSKIHYNLGLTYDMMGHLDATLEEYQKAAQLNPLDPETHNNLGIVYSNKGFQTHFSSTPISLNEFGRCAIFTTVAYVIGLISEKRSKGEEELRETRDYLDSLIRYANTPIIVWDPKFRITRFNHAFERLTGYAVEEVIDKELSILFPEASREESLSKTARTLSGEYWELVEIPILRKDGDIRLVLWNSANISASDGKTLTATIAQGTDITERKKRGGQIKASLREKEVLLKEIHHRVKNNLQIISSLLSLQSRYTESKETLKMLKESRARIRSIALIHEKLYRSKDLARIDFGAYIRNLIADLFDSYAASPDTIAVRIDVDDIFLEIDTAIPCALIINELVSNCLKYAFPQSKKGEVRIGLHPENDGKSILMVSDDGIGFPENVDFQNTRSLGLRLVNTLVNQLGGMMEVRSEGGTEFKIVFTALSCRRRRRNSGTCADLNS